ncbi:hypothetical protein K440DRAFT_631955 [Wilcoxina mikolae CBS 423.85]|nr:hypothetical protein K440DRAFT_631955 [Wilcoxina mikolae CBS 423.85]
MNQNIDNNQNINLDLHKEHRFERGDGYGRGDDRCRDRCCDYGCGGCGGCGGYGGGNGGDGGAFSDNNNQNINQNIDNNQNIQVDFHKEERFERCRERFGRGGDRFRNFGFGGREGYGGGCGY